MKIFGLLSILASALSLSGCETSNTYMKVADGPDYGYARAKCSNEAMGTERGFFASGSIGYVVGASVGSMVVNEIRKQQYVKNCMMMEGWQNVAKTKGNVAKGQVATKAYASRHENSAFRTYRRDPGLNRPPKRIVAGM